MLFLVLSEEGSLEFQKKRDEMRSNNNVAPYAVGSKRRWNQESAAGPSKK